MGILVVVYAGSYFFFVSPLRASICMFAGGCGRVVPMYWGLPSWVNATALYGPIHVLDEKLIRPSKWKAPQRRVEAYSEP